MAALPPGVWDGMVINALFTHASRCLLLWLGLIKRDIAGEALFAHCDRKKGGSYFVVKDFALFSFSEEVRRVWSLNQDEDAIRAWPRIKTHLRAVVHLLVHENNVEPQIQGLGLFGDVNKLNYDLGVQRTTRNFLHTFLRLSLLELFYICKTLLLAQSAYLSI